MVNVKKRISATAGITAMALAAVPSIGFAQFTSGSTGELGAFTSTTSQAIPLPDDGVLNYTTFTVQNNATITFLPNAANTPVRLLATGEISIAGTLDVSGKSGTGSFIGGFGGPGGFDGGRGAAVGETRGTNGKGPGGALGREGCGGSGGGYATAGRSIVGNGCESGAGQRYGSRRLVPLIGGSGGAGGAAPAAGSGTFPGGAGGGGGGAILLASSTTLDLRNASVLARGGQGRNETAQTANGGGGSGGAIRLVAPTVLLPGGSRLIFATGGLGVQASDSALASGDGAIGRILIEANEVTGGFTRFSPQPIVNRLTALEDPSASPTLRITQIDGLEVPAATTGTDDVFLPAGGPSLVNVEFATTGVPLGSRVTLIAMPEFGEPVRRVSNPVAGSVDAGTASVDVDLPLGHTVLSATLSFAVVPSSPLVGIPFEQIDGDAIKRVEVAVDGTGESRAVLITASGRRVPWDTDSALLR